MRHCCKNCHFLAKIHIWRNGQERSFSWDEKERLNFRLRIEEDHCAVCYKGVWSTRITPHLNTSLKDILLKDRKNHCFFIETHKGMSFQAASELHRLRNDNRQLKRSYRYTQIGLWIAAGSLLMNLIMQILKMLGLTPR